MFMNEHDIDEALVRFSRHPLLGPATKTIDSLRDGVNACSDGWPYWQRPQRAAKRLSDLIVQAGRALREQGCQSPATPWPGAADLKAAYAQLRRFRSKYPQCRFLIFPAPGVKGDEALPQQHGIEVTGNRRIDGATAEIAVALRDACPGGRDQGYYNHAQRLRDEILAGASELAEK